MRLIDGRGKITFQAEGLSLEKMLNLCKEQGIVLDHVKRTGARGITARCPVKRWTYLKDTCEGKGWKITWTGYTGVRRLWEEGKLHRLSCLAAVLMVCCMAAATLFIWQIRIEGAGVYEGDIRSFLAEKGIHVGMLKSQLHAGMLADELEWRYPKTAWVYADLRGSTLVIQLVEGIPEPEIVSCGKTGDLVADRGGIVLSVEPQAGTAVVKPGDIVVPGQVLIKGEERRGTEATIPVKARGKVWARVWDRVGVMLPTSRIITEPTGETDTCWDIEWAGKWERDRKPPAFANADRDVQRFSVGGCWWPVSLRKTTYYEVTLRKETRPVAEVRIEAERAALRLLSEKTGLGNDVVDKWLDCCMIEGGMLAVYATAERRLDIAAYPPREENAATLLQALY